MRHRIKVSILAGLVAGALAIPASSALAKDFWHWSKENNRWDHRADVKSDRQDLEEARRQLRYDNSHHASREKLAQDNARIQDLERDLRADRREHRR